MSHHGTKFGAKMLIDAQMAAAAIVNLLPVAIFDTQPTFHCWFERQYKIWCQYLNRRLIYGNFSKFKMAAVRNLGFSKIWLLTNGWPSAADFPSLYQMWCKNVDRRPNYDLKTNSKLRPPPSWIYFRWLFLTYNRLSTVDLNHHTKFGANISIGGWFTATF